MSSLIGLLLLFCSACGFAIGAEHHLLLCGNSPHEVSRAFNVRPDEDSREEVFYLDTDTLSLYRRGVILRIRLAEKAKIDVKLRPVLLDHLPREWRDHPDVKCEYDIKPQSRSAACRMRRTLSAKKARRLIKFAELEGLFQREQLEFLKHAKKLSLDLASLRIYGPTRIDSWSSKRFSFELAIVSLKHNQFLAEISTRKGSSEESYEWRLLSLARSKNMKICRSQDSKTKRILSSLRGL